MKINIKMILSIWFYHYRNEEKETDIYFFIINWIKYYINEKEYSLLIKFIENKKLKQKEKIEIKYIFLYNFIKIKYNLKSIRELENKFNERYFLNFN